MQASTRLSNWLFLITFALAFYGMGASFVESFVNYPTWPLVGPNEFRAFHQTLGPRIVRVLVIPLMVLTVLTALLLWRRPAPIPRWAVLLSLAIQVMVWIATFSIHIPIQMELSANGQSLPLIDRLIVTNWWLRRIPHLINSGLFLWMMSLLLRERTADDERPDDSADIAH